MKIAFSILLLITTGFSSYSQNNLDSLHPLFRGDINGDLIRKSFFFSYTHSPRPDKKNLEKLINPEIILSIFSSNKLSITKQLAHEKLPALKNFKQQLSERIEIPEGGYTSSYPIPVFDSSGIIVTAHGINKQNAANYEFRVMENISNEIIPWRSISLFCQSYLLTYKWDGTEETEMAYLGEFKTSFGNGLTFEIRKKNRLAALFPKLPIEKDSNESIKNLFTISAVWINRAPEVLGVFTSNNMESFLEVFKRQWQYDSKIQQSSVERLTKDSFLVQAKQFKAAENNLIFYLDDKIKSKDIIEYNLVRNNKSSGWKANDFDLNLIWLKNLSPGKYSLQMRYSIQRHNISSYDFTVEASWHQTMAYKLIISLLGLSLIGFFILLFRNWKAKQQAVFQQLQKQQTETELKSIRSQFNPHFVFNALNSIQGLITKNDLNGANRYLSEFSTLLRDSLKGTSNEMISLFTEIKMLDSYLKLEQLRFGFSYSIKVDETINSNSVEVPALLLQPLVENAIKHGIASLYEKGNLYIYFKRSGNNMLVEILDNGKGFNPLSATDGYGLKLTEERIRLQNAINKDQPIELSFRSSGEGTILHLLFKNWLA
ncbi:MAG: sensor histidine kinase [Chitinophagaceae bacterium]